MESIAIKWEYRLLLVLAIRQKLKIVWHFEMFVNAGPYGAGHFKALLRLQFLFHRISGKLYEYIDYTVGRYRLVIFVVISRFLKTLWHFEILTRESVGKS